MSPDLKLATIYVMPLGGKNINVVLSALERHKKFLRGELARRDQSADWLPTFVSRPIRASTMVRRSMQFLNCPR